jgi:hypothetical protein
MHIINSEPTPLKKERRKDQRVSRPKDRLCDVWFKREMTAESAIAAKDDVDFLVCGFGDLGYVCADCADEGFCFGWWEGARVC